jgi:hypothetical protein
MKKQIEVSKRSLGSWSIVARIALTAAFAFWSYLIWNSMLDFNKNLNLFSSQYSAVHNVQVEFKNEIQEWKNLLLRSKSRDTLDKNWQIYETQYAKVAAQAQDIIAKNDIRLVQERMKTFLEAHASNHDLYQKSLAAFTKNGFDPLKADASVQGIDRPLLDYLEAADVAMQDESKNVNERLTAKAKNQIEQSLLVLGLIALLVIWIPKW